MNEGPVESEGQFHDSHLLGTAFIGPLTWWRSINHKGTAILAGGNAWESDCTPKMSQQCGKGSTWDLPNLENPKRSLLLGGEDHLKGPKVCFFCRECILTCVSNICHPLAQSPCARSRGYGKLWSQGRVGRSGKAFHWTWEMLVGFRSIFFLPSSTNRKWTCSSGKAPKKAWKALKSIYDLMVGSWGALDKLQSRYDVFLPLLPANRGAEEERSNCFQQTTLGTWDLKPGLLGV